MDISTELIKKAIRSVNSNKNRAKDMDGRAGGLIDLTKDEREIIVIGDLHGAFDNLIKIVEHQENKRKLKEKTAILVILGDGLHNDQTGQMMEMQSSLLVLEEIFNLILTYGENVIYIKGNHDTFEERLAKSGIKQGTEFKNYLLMHRGEEYTAEVERFFDALPFVVIGPKYLITHAGPIRGGCNRDDIVNIHRQPELCHQLVWNRIHEFRGTPSMKEYDGSDIAAMLKAMKMSADSFFIVGHNPLWNSGNRTGIWRDVIGIKNHIIIYSNIATRGPYLLINNGKIEEFYSIEKAPEGYYVR